MKKLKDKEKIQVEFNNSFVGLRIKGINYSVPEDVFKFFKQMNTQIQRTHIFNEFLLFEKDIDVNEFNKEFEIYLKDTFGSKKK